MELSWLSDALQKETEEMLQTKHGSKSQLSRDTGPIGGGWVGIENVHGL